MPDSTGQPRPERADERPSLRDRLYLIIFEADTPWGKAFDIALIFAILASVVVVVLSTLDVAQEAPWQGVFLGAEWAFTIIFTIEYALRLWIARRPLRCSDPCGAPLAHARVEIESRDQDGDEGTEAAAHGDAEHKTIATVWRERR